MQFFHLPCSLSAADDVTVGNQPKNKTVIWATVAFKFKEHFTA